MKMQPLSTEVYETVLDLYESGDGFEFGIMNDPVSYTHLTLPTTTIV